MPTAKKRINITVDDDLYTDLTELQQLRGAPSLSSIVIELAKEALELQEDLYFAKIADERDAEKVITHKDIWR